MKLLKNDKIKAEITTILNNKDSASDKLQRICNLLRTNIESYEWVGFYLVDRKTESELVLGPFAGNETDHTRIGFGEGICGQAALTRSVFIVDDVSAESNYLSCSPDVKSEFVAPVLWNNQLVGELDLDSGKIAAFGEGDTALLKWVAKVTAEAVALLTGFKLAE